MSVALLASSSYPTGIVPDTGAGPLSWSHVNGATAPKGVLIFVAQNLTGADAANYCTGVTYGGVTVPEVSGSSVGNPGAGGENSRVTAYFLGVGIPTGTQTVVATRVNNSVGLYACCATFSAVENTAITGTATWSVSNALFTAQPVSDLSNGRDSIRVMAIRCGAPSLLTPATGCNTIQNIDYTDETFSLILETTPSQGTFSVGTANFTNYASVIALAVIDGQPVAENNRGAAIGRSAISRRAIASGEYQSGAPALSVDKISQGHTVDVTAVTEHAALAPIDISQGHTIDAPGLVEHLASITIAKISQGETLDAPGITQHAALAPNKITQDETIDAPALLQHWVITPIDISQGHTIDTTAMVLGGVLSADRIEQGNTLDTLGVTEHAALAPDNVYQDHTIDLLTLLQHAGLAPLDITHDHTIDATGLTSSMLMILVNKLTQGQALDTLNLTTHNVLAVDDLTQQQIVDAINFGGIVVSALAGTFVIYAKLGGKHVTFQSLTGKIETLH